MLSHPALALCSDRTRAAQLHPSGKGPEAWFSRKRLTEAGLYGLSFDFFTDWSAEPPTVRPTLWTKCLLDEENTYEELEGGLREALERLHTPDGILRYASFGRQHGMQAHYLVFRDDQDWGLDDAELLVVALELEGQSSVRLRPWRVTLAELKAQIQRHSGGPVRLGGKGLTYGTSRLECALSKTDSAYPGDTDCVLLDADGAVVALLEFKKHTLPTAIETQELRRYYPTPDRRKYDRLAALRDRVSPPGAPAPLFNVYYPTRAALTGGRVELVAGPIGHLRTAALGDFALEPGPGDGDVLDKVLDGVRYHRESLAA